MLTIPTNLSSRMNPLVDLLQCDSKLIRYPWKSRLVGGRTACPFRLDYAARKKSGWLCLSLRSEPIADGLKILAAMVTAFGH